MDFNNELSAFQGAIISADNVHQFSRLNSKGGNEEKVNYVIQSVKRFLLMEKYIDENGLLEPKITSTRKFAMYIILNTDLPVLQDMIDMSELEPIIWSIPTVPQYLMCEMMFEFHLERFVYELIPNCWPQLGLEVAEAFLKNIKYFGPTECIHKLYKLSTASYLLLCRVTCFNYRDEHELTEVLKIIFATIETFLKYFLDPPNKHRLDALNDDDLYKYKGNRFRCILKVVYECFSQYIDYYKPNCDDALYRSTYNVDYLYRETYKVCDNPNKSAVECLNNTNALLLECFKQITMDVSVDIFCAWSEFEEDGKTVQQGIGELCDKVHTMMLSISSIAEHPVVGMIQLMARKPTKIEDIINNTDTATILQKINVNDEESLLWIHALSNKEYLGTNIQLIDVVKANLNVFQESECYKLYNALKDITSEDFERREILIYLKINLFHRCNVIDKHRILRVHFRDKIFIDTERTGEDFATKLNEMFNKFVADIDVDFTDVLTAFYQNPNKVFSKIFCLATQNGPLIEPMLKLVILLKDYRDFFYEKETEPCMIKIIKHILNNYLQIPHYRNIIKFLCELKKHEVISSPHILLLVIMPNMHNALLSEHIKKMYIQLKLLIEAYTMEELSSYRAPVLVMTGQVMEIMRKRNIAAFELDALQTLEIAIRFQKTVINTYRDVIPDSDGSWLRLKIRDLKLHPLNFYYYKSLWNADNRSYFESVTEMQITANASLNRLAVQLTQIIPWAVLDEWCDVWENFINGGLQPKQALRVFHSAMDAVIQAVDDNRTAKTLACLFFCFRQLMHIIRYKFFKEPLTNSQIKTSVSLLSKNLKRTNPLDTNEMEAIIGPLFAYLAGRKSDYTVNITKYFRNTTYFTAVIRFIPSESPFDMEDL